MKPYVAFKAEIAEAGWTVVRDRLVNGLITITLQRGVETASYSVVGVYNSDMPRIRNAVVNGRAVSGRDGLLRALKEGPL